MTAGMKRGTPVLAWIWVMVVLAAYLAQFRELLPALAAMWLR